MLSPILTLFKHFPLRAYSTVLIMLAISWYTYKRVKCGCENGTVTKQRGLLFWLLINYTVLLLFFTVFGRRSLDYYRYNFDPLYSYRDVFLVGDFTLAVQIAANIAVFVPVGLLVCLLAKRFRFLKTLLCGILLSLSIEALQWILRCGYVEIDDLVSNSLGTLLGGVAAEVCHFVRYCRRWYEKRKKEREACPENDGGVS